MQILIGWKICCWTVTAHQHIAKIVVISGFAENNFSTVDISLNPSTFSVSELLYVTLFSHFQSRFRDFLLSLFAVAFCSTFCSHFLPSLSITFRHFLQSLCSPFPSLCSHFQSLCTTSLQSLSVTVCHYSKKFQCQCRANFTPSWCLIYYQWK